MTDFGNPEEIKRRFVSLHKRIQIIRELEEILLEDNEAAELLENKLTEIIYTHK